MTKSEFMNLVIARNPDQPEFLQAVTEVIDSIWEVYEANPVFQDANVLERLVEPDRVVMFRVPWTTDEGEVVVNRGYRVEFNSSIGPYKRWIAFPSQREPLDLEIPRF